MAHSHGSGELLIASWNINGKGSPDHRQKVLRHYLERIKRNEEESTPDLVFLQEVPWVANGSITAPMLKGTCYSHTKGSWVKEGEGGPYNVVLYNTNKLTPCRGEIMDELRGVYRTLDDKHERGKKVYDRYDSDVKLQRAATDSEEAASFLGEFGDRRSFEYFSGSFEMPQFSGPQRADKVLKGRFAIDVFEVITGQDGSRIMAVSFHNRNPRRIPEKLLFLLLHVLKELHDLTGYPILLAGDFNMDVSNLKKANKSYLGPLIAPYHPMPYTRTVHRRSLQCIDHIMLWDDGLTFTLGPVQAHLVEIPFQNQGKSEGELRDGVSNHDPLTAMLRVTRRGIKQEVGYHSTATPVQPRPLPRPQLHPPPKFTTVTKVEVQVPLQPQMKQTLETRNFVTRSTPGNHVGDVTQGVQLSPLSHVQPSPSSQHVQPSPSSRHVQPSPSSQHIQPSPSSRHVQPSPSSQHVQPSPSSRHVQPSPSSQHVQPSPSSRHVQPSPSTRHVQPSPSSQHVQPSPSSRHVQPLPSSQHVQPSPSSQHVQLLPSSQHIQPSNYVQPSSSTRQVVVTDTRFNHTPVYLHDRRGLMNEPVHQPTLPPERRTQVTRPVYNIQPTYHQPGLRGRLYPEPTYVRNQRDENSPQSQSPSPMSPFTPSSSQTQSYPKPTYPRHT